MNSNSAASVGALIRAWRTRRRMSQLDLAGEADVSQRHLSFLESGRAAPSREMVVRLAERLDLPLRHRNRLLLAAGFAPGYGESDLDDQSFAPAMDAVRMVLECHRPNPAIAVDRHWKMVAANHAINPLVADVADASLLRPPVNVLRLSLHPQGLAPRIANLAEWRAHVLQRLRHQNQTFADPALEELERELQSYPGGVTQTRPIHNEGTAIAQLLRLRIGDATLSLISTITVFGTPLDVTLSELAIESFFPADQGTRVALERLSLASA